MSVSPDFKLSVHAARAVARMTAILRRVEKAFTYIEKDVYSGLYKSLFLPLVLFAVKAKGNIDKLETLQERASV